MSSYNPAEHTIGPECLCMTRRQMLSRAGMGMGALSLGMILEGLTGPEQASAAAVAKALTGPLAPKKSPLPAKAKHVIHIFASGGPSQVDTWDPKPALTRFDGKTVSGLDGAALASTFKFEKKGRSGIEVSSVFPELGRMVDDMAIIRSLHTDIPAHDLASRFLHTGSSQMPKPSLGAWTLYGLGTDNQNLPGFIAMGAATEFRQASFLPSQFQGVGVNYNKGMPLDKIIRNIHNSFTTAQRQRLQIDLARHLNELHAKNLHRDEQLEARIESFEMAFKMQTEATDAFDISKEPQNIRSMYGDTNTGARLLVARRLVERGVRFIQVEAGGWDHHANIAKELPKRAAEIDQPAAALLKDLKQRGLLDSTLVIWGGEFGRTVTGSGADATGGRDHNGRGFCCWMAGGGVKGGTVYGSTSELGDRAEENGVHVRDLHATILRLLGFDHTKLTYRYNGRDFRLTDNAGEVVTGVIA